MLENSYDMMWMMTCQQILVPSQCMLPKNVLELRPIDGRFDAMDRLSVSSPMHIGN